MRAVCLLLAGTVAALAGCVTVHFDRRLGFEPVPDAVLDDLRARRADLGVCLAQLGAPNLVQEQPDGSIALAWAWLDQFGWGIDASINLRGVAISGDFDGDQRSLEGAVVFFDGNLQFLSLERGLLRDFLMSTPRRRPYDADSVGR